MVLTTAFILYRLVHLKIVHLVLTEWLVDQLQTNTVHAPPWRGPATLPSSSPMECSHTLTKGGARDCVICSDPMMGLGGGEN